MGEELSEKGNESLKKDSFYIQNQLYAEVQSINLKR